MIREIVECDLCQKDNIPSNHAYRKVKVNISWSEGNTQSEQTFLGDLCSECFDGIREYLAELKEDAIPEDLKGDDIPEEETERYISPRYAGFAGDPE